MTDQTNLPLIWADTGGVTDPGDIKYSTGWISEIPTFQNFNFVLQNQTKNLLALAEKGQFGWESTIVYTKGAQVIKNFTLYTCIFGHTNQDPALDATHSYWTLGYAYGTNSANLVASHGLLIDEVNTVLLDKWDGNAITINNTNALIAFNTTGAFDNYVLGNVKGEFVVANVGNTEPPDGRSIDPILNDSYRIFHEGHPPVQAEVSGTIPANPVDGKLYGRLNTNWVEVTATKVQEFPPQPVQGNGNGWYNLQDGELYVDIDDGDTSQWVPASPKINLGDKVAKAGDTMDGPLIGVATTGPGDLARTDYVDAGDAALQAQVDLRATIIDVDAADVVLQDNIDLKAPINSPVLTGIPEATIPTDNSNPNRIATTQFVINNSVGGATIQKVVGGNANWMFLIDGAVWGSSNNGTNFANQLVCQQQAVNTQLHNGVCDQLTKMYFDGVSLMVDVVVIGECAYALTDSGDLYTWGFNTYGQLGTGDTVHRYQPELVLTGVEKIFGTDSQMGYSVAVTSMIVMKTDGSHWATGYNVEGNLGVGDAITKNTWTQVLAIPAFSEVYGGRGQNCANFAVAPDGTTLYAWGYNGTGQIGDGTLVDVLTPVNVTAIWNPNTLPVKEAHTYGRYYSTVASNYQTAIVVFDNVTNYEVRGCGANSFGQLGDGTTVAKTTPNLIKSGVGSVDFYIKGDLPSMYLLLDNGELWVWSYNNHGQLGLGNVTASILTPTLAISGVSQLLHRSVNKHSLNHRTACFIRMSAGEIRSTGYNTAGELGTGTTAVTNLFTTVLLDNPSEVIDIIAQDNGNSNTAYLAYSANGYSVWGYNATDSISYGNNTNCYVPYKVSLARVI